MTFLSPAPESTEAHPQTSERAGVAAAVQLYVDGYLGQDAGVLRRAFHPDSHLMTTEAGQVSSGATAAWFDRIEQKRREGSGTLAARHELLGIDLTPPAAIAKVRLTFETHTFTDYLSLLRTDRGWQIVNKIYAVREADG
jgi:hypothetical protein